MPMIVKGIRPTDEIVAIRELTTRWNDAFQAKDADGMMAFYPPDDEIVIYDIMAPLEYSGNDSYHTSWRTFFGAIEGNPVLENRDLQVKCSADVGFTHALTHITGRMGGSDVDLWIRDTKCLRKIDGQWLFVHDHLSVPVDIASGKACLNLFPSWRR